MLWALASMPSADAWDKIKAPVLAQFVERDGRLINLKLEEQFKSMASYHTMTEARAKKAAEARWGKSGEQTDVSSMPQAMLGDASSTVSSSASSTVEAYSTVQSGMAASQINGEKQKNTETIINPDEIALRTHWKSNFLNAPYDPGDMIGLLQNYTWEDIAGVMAWLNYIHKGNGKFNWMEKINSTADFARCFKGMFPQYQKCGGYKVAMVAKDKFESNLEQERRSKKAFSYDDEPAPVDAETVARIRKLAGLPAKESDEVIAVDDVRDAV